MKLCRNKKHAMTPANTISNRLGHALCRACHEAAERRRQNRIHEKRLQAGAVNEPEMDVVDLDAIPGHGRVARDTYLRMLELLRIAPGKAVRMRFPVPVRAHDYLSTIGQQHGLRLRYAYLSTELYVYVTDADNLRRS